MSGNWGGRGRGGIARSVQRKMVMSRQSIVSPEGDGEAEMLISFACKFCGAAFPERFKLRQHINGKHKQPKFQCSGCGQRFQWSSSHFYHKNKCPHYLEQQRQILSGTSSVIHEQPKILAHASTDDDSYYDQSNFQC